jgi:hypothetical protein
MSRENVERTRRSLHGVAEMVLAGPQYDTCGSIRLRVTPGGFATVAVPDLRVDGLELVSASTRLPLGGTFAGLARAAGVRARALRDVYADGPGVAEDDPVQVDPDAADQLLEALARGDAAMRAFAADEEPVLWPEHFDVGISLAGVNYGVSPGDGHVAEPYAYVGPWEPREGEFWDRPFGAMRLLTEVPDVSALAEFFCEGAARAVADPVALRDSSG